MSNNKNARRAVLGTVTSIEGKRTSSSSMSKSALSSRYLNKTTAARGKRSAT